MCRASLVRRGQLLCFASRSQGENPSPLFLSLPTPALPLQAQGFTTGGRKRARDQGGVKRRSDRAIFVGTLVALNWSHAASTLLFVPVRDFAKSGNVAPLAAPWRCVRRRAYSRLPNRTSKRKAVVSIREDWTSRIAPSNQREIALLVQLSLHATPTVAGTRERSLRRVAGYEGGCDRDRTFSRSNRTRHALVRLSLALWEPSRLIVRRVVDFLSKPNPPTIRRIRKGENSSLSSSASEIRISEFSLIRRCLCTRTNSKDRRSGWSAIEMLDRYSGRVLARYSASLCG